MNDKKLEEEARKKRTDPVYSATWPDESDKDWDLYVKMMSSRLIIPANKNTSKKCCLDPKKYKNGMGGLKFWSCSNCGADLGDAND
jgi:hypothetical protein